jgi:NAD+ diphosphatase
MSAVNGQVSKMDRASHLRENAQTLDQLWTKSKIVHFSQGRLAVNTDATELHFLSAVHVEQLIQSGEFKTGERYFLGLDQVKSESYFAWNSDHPKSESDVAPAGYATLREIGGDLDEMQMELALHCVAFSNWHNSHPHCARCGAQTSVAKGGAVRICSADKSEHYPRTDCAVIVLVRDSQDRILLGRQGIWPEGRFSCFAGFLEPGETFEQCVQREVSEESGVAVREINYLGSQPWPFPASIMISFEAITDFPEVARPDGHEIVEIKWLTRAELTSQVADGSLSMPPAMSVSRKMIDRWLHA